MCRDDVAGQKLEKIIQERHRRSFSVQGSKRARVGINKNPAAQPIIIVTAARHHRHNHKSRFKATHKAAPSIHAKMAPAFRARARKSEDSPRVGKKNTYAGGVKERNRPQAGRIISFPVYAIHAQMAPGVQR